MTNQEALEHIKYYLREDPLKQKLRELDPKNTQELEEVLVVCKEALERYDRIKNYIKPICDSEKLCDECIFINEDGFCLQDLMIGSGE